MSGKTAIVIGATGLIGGFVLQELLASDDYDRVIAVVRRPVLPPHPKLVVMETPFDQLDKTLAGIKASEAFCCLGTTIRQAGTKAEFHKVDYGYSYSFAHRLRQNGCRHLLLVSALGASASSPVFYNRVKGRLETDIEALGFKQLSIFRPSLLLGQRQEPRLAEALTARLSPLLTPFLIGALSRLHPIPGSTVAKAMVAAANKGGEGETLYYYHDIQGLLG